MNANNQDVEVRPEEIQKFRKGLEVVAVAMWRCRNPSSRITDGQIREELRGLARRSFSKGR